MANARKKKKKKAGIGVLLHARPFTLLACGLAVMTLALIVQLPRMMGSLDRQDEDILAKMQEYSELQAERNVVLSELARIGDEEYIEKIARRVHHYGWYGETIYEVGNLAEIQAAQENGGGI